MVAKLDRLEMLPGIKECAQGDRHAQQNQARAFAHTIGRYRAHQARIIDVLDSEEFSHCCHAFPCGAPCWPAVAGWSESIFSATRIFALRRADWPQFPRPKLGSLSSSKSSAPPPGPAAENTVLPGGLRASGN